MNPEERDELHQLFTEAWNSSAQQSFRNAYLINGIRDAVQAHRKWATITRAQAESIGLATMLKAWAKSERVTVADKKGRKFGKARVIGTLTKGDEGSEHFTQMEFDGMSVEQLKRKRAAYIQQIRAYRGGVVLMDKLLALCESAGESTPGAAAVKLGTTVEKWLAA